MELPLSHVLLPSFMDARCRVLQVVTNPHQMVPMQEALLQALSQSTAEAAEGRRRLRENVSDGGNCAN